MQMDRQDKAVLMTNPSNNRENQTEPVLASVSLTQTDQRYRMNQIQTV